MLWNISVCRVESRIQDQLQILCAWCFSCQGQYLGGKQPAILCKQVVFVVSQGSRNSVSSVTHVHKVFLCTTKISQVYMFVYTFPLIVYCLSLFLKDIGKSFRHQIIL